MTKRPALALLVIDMVQDFLPTVRSKDRSELIAATNDLTKMVHDHSGTVIWVRQEFRPDLSDAFLDMRRTGEPITIAGTPGCQLDPELIAGPEDRTLVKRRYSAFFETDLDRLLLPFAGTSLIIAGINTHACVRMTAIDAYQRDWDVIVASDCIASYDPQHHAISLEYMDGKIARALSNLEISSWLAGRGKQRR